MRSVILIEQVLMNGAIWVQISCTSKDWCFGRNSQLFRVSSIYRDDVKARPGQANPKRSRTPYKSGKRSSTWTWIGLYGIYYVVVIYKFKYHGFILKKSLFSKNSLQRKKFVHFTCVMWTWNETYILLECSKVWIRFNKRDLNMNLEHV